MSQKHNSIFQVSDVTSAELFEYSKRNKDYINDVVFFTKNDPGHGDIYLNGQLYTYFHDLDYSYNIIYDDKFTCRLTRDKENHTLQLTYVTCDIPEITFINEIEATYTLNFTINNPVDNIFYPEIEGTSTCESRVLDISKVNDKQYNITLNNPGIDVEDKIIYTYIHNGQKYQYTIPVHCIRTNIPCSEIILNPEYTYLYEGESTNISYYFVPQNTSDEIFTYNLNVSYVGDTTNGYTVSYIITKNDGIVTQVAYAYNYMIEEKFENTKLFLYSTDISLRNNNVGKVSATIYPPEVLDRVKLHLHDNNSYIKFYLNDQYDNPIPNNYLEYDELSGTVVFNTAFGPDPIGITNNHYHFDHADTYKITAYLNIQGSEVSDSLYYPVGLTPLVCSSMKAWVIDPSESPDFDYTETPIEINSMTKYDTNVSDDFKNYRKFVLERYYPGIDFNYNDNNNEYIKCIQKNSDVHFENESYSGEIIKYEPNTPFDGPYYREEFIIYSADNIENNTIDNLTFYANDGSHCAYTVKMQFKSNYISPMFERVGAYLISDGVKSEFESTSICTNPRKQYCVSAFYSPQNATSFDNVHYGETGKTTYLSISNFEVDNQNSYLYFNAKANSYAPDGNKIKLFTQNVKSSAYVELPVENEGSMLSHCQLRSEVSYLGMFDSHLFFTYMPSNAVNVTMDDSSFNYTVSPDIYTDKLDIVRDTTIDKVIENNYYFGYKINYPDKSFNEDNVKIRISGKLKQELSDTEIFEKAFTIGSVSIPKRTATLSASTSIIDRLHVENDTYTLYLTINSGLNKYNGTSMGLYYGVQRDDRPYIMYSLSSTGYSITKPIDLSVTNNGEYRFAVFQKIGSDSETNNYLRISQEIIIPVVTSSIPVSNVYDIVFEKDKYLVNDENIKLNVLVNGDVTVTNNLIFYFSNQAFTCYQPTWGDMEDDKRWVSFTIKCGADFINSMSRRQSLSVYTNFNSGLGTFTTIYPIIDICSVKLYRNNQECYDIYENGTGKFNKLTIGFTCKKMLTGEIVPESDLYSVEYILDPTGDIGLCGITDKTCIAHVGVVGKNKVIVKVNGVNYYSNTFKQWTLPTQISVTDDQNNSVSSITGYDGFEKSINVEIKFKSGSNFGDEYKALNCSYFYDGCDEKYDITQTNFTTTCEVGKSTSMRIACAYNNTHSTILTGVSYITGIDIPEILFVKGNAKSFAQLINVKTHNIAGQVGSLNEEYSYTSSICDSVNMSLEFAPNSQYNDTTAIQYTFNKKIGSDEFALTTKINSPQYVGYYWNDTMHNSISYTQIIKPIKVENTENTYPSTTAYAFLVPTSISDGFNRIYKHQVAGGSNKYENITNINVNNIYFSNSTSDFNNLSTYFFIHEYASFANTTAYNTCIYSRIADTNSITSETIKVAAINRNWNILNNGDYFNLGSYFTYMSVLWYDKPISEILPPKTRLIDGTTYTIPYQGVINTNKKNTLDEGYEGSYVIPLTYNIINQYSDIKAALDEHLLSEYTIYTGQGDNSINPKTLSLYRITIDASGSGTTASVSCSNIENLSKLKTLKVTIKYMATFPSIENELTFTLIENGVIKSVPKNELGATFKWWFDGSTVITPVYTMSISKIEYEFNNTASTYYNKLEVNNVYIKYRTDAQIMILSYSDFDLYIGNNTQTHPYTIFYFTELGCIHWPTSPWDNFMLNNYHTLYTTNTQMIKI